MEGAGFLNEFQAAELRNSHGKSSIILRRVLLSIQSGAERLTDAVANWERSRAVGLYSHDDWHAPMVVPEDMMLQVLVRTTEGSVHGTHQLSRHPNTVHPSGRMPTVSPGRTRTRSLLLTMWAPRIVGPVSLHCWWWQQ